MDEELNAVMAIAFDLDGTLVDSAPDIAHALNCALRLAGLDAFDPSAVREWIGDGPDRLIARAMAANAAGAVDAVVDVADATRVVGENAGSESLALRATLRRDFDAATFAAPLLHGAVYPDITDTLQALHPVFQLVVVTNKPTALARAVLEAAGLQSLFTAVYGADRAELRKPLPAMLVQAANDLGVATRQLLMVGDSSADMNAAKAAGSPAVLVGWGYGHVKAQNSRPSRQIGRPQQLTALLIPSPPQICAVRQP